MEARQQTIDFPRASQLAALRDCELVTLVHDGKTISAGFAKAVLGQIDHFARDGGECWASLQRIACGCNRSLRHVKRAVAALVAASLLTCERGNKGTTKRYRIVWNELGLLSKGRAPTGVAAARVESAAVPPRQPIQPGQSNGGSCTHPTSVPWGPNRSPSKVPQGPTRVPQGPSKVPLGHEVVPQGHPKRIEALKNRHQPPVCAPASTMAGRRRRQFCARSDWPRPARWFARRKPAAKTPRRLRGE